MMKKLELKQLIKESIKEILKESDGHTIAIGMFYRVAGNYIEKFKIGGNQKLQKLIGEDLFYKKGGDWWWNNTKIVGMTTTELKNLINKITSAKNSWKEYKENEAINNHTANLLLMAILVGDRADVLEAERLERIVKRGGGLDGIQEKDSYTLHKKLYPKFKIYKPQ